MSEMSPELPPDPFLDQDIMPMAKVAFNMFTAFVASGFTEPQAIQVVVGVLTGMMNNAAKKPG
jgi:hypothetical protein